MYVSFIGKSMSASPRCHYVRWGRVILHTHMTRGPVFGGRQTNFQIYHLFHRQAVAHNATSTSKREDVAKIIFLTVWL